ncbi:MAG: ABC transporter substrate-binding protein [Clostridiales Family XIII bacterium]|nr:ABC transporter substrate-binding protein [Clostridiales Family XIII bacterium]
MKKFVATTLISALIALCFAGCSGSSDSETPPPSDDPAASETPSGATADDAVVAYVGTTIFDGGLDPIKGSMSYGYSFTNAALLKVNPQSEYVGDMATAWDVSADALVYTFDLRQGVKFGDGSDMTAEDVVFTYERVREKQAENENADLTKLVSVKALSDYKVEFTLSEPYSPFLDTTAMLGIVPADGYDAEAFEHRPVGTGPWKVVQYDANQQIILEPNENYYEGPPTVGRVTLVYMEQDAALAAARSGQLDVVMVSPNHASETVSGMTMFPLETMDIRNVSLPVRPAQERDGLMVGNDVTSDKNVRQALAIGIDRAAIIQNAFNGIGKPATGFTSNLIWAGTDVYEDNRKDEAAALLENAGWVDADGDGFREKDGVACEFDVYAAEDRYVLAAALAEDAAVFGVKINPHSSSWDDISANMNTSGVVWGWGQYSPTVIASLFDSQYAFSGGFNNVVAYSDPEVDALIAQAFGETNQEAAIEKWKQAQALANADFPYLYIVNIEHCYFVSDRLDISPDTQIPHPHGHGSPIICNMKDWKFK